MRVTLSALLLLLAACVPAWALSYQDAVQRLDAAERGDQRAFQRTCSELAGQIDGAVQRRCFQAAALASVGRSVEAEALALRIGMPDEAEAGIAYVDLMRRLGQREAAVVAVDRLGRERGGLVRALAHEVAAAIAEDDGRRRDALASLGSAADVLRKFDEYDEGGLHRKRIAAGIERLERILALELHGPGFVLYRRANEQRLRDRHPDALALWDELLALSEANAGHGDLLAEVLRAKGPLDESMLWRLPIEPVYADAARAYRLEALLALGRIEEARADCAAFCAADPGGLYRVEAAGMVARNALYACFDATAAERFGALGIASLEAAVDRAAGALPQVRAASVGLTQPPPQRMGHDGFGNPQPVKPVGRQVLNRTTADWYLGWQELGVRRTMAVVRFIAGDRVGAMTELRRTQRLDAHDLLLGQNGWPSTYARLEAGIRRGTFFAYEQEAARFTGRARVAFVLAEWSYYSGDHLQAVAMCRSSRAQLPRRGPASSDAHDYIDYLEAIALWTLDRDDEARELAERFDHDRGQSLTWGRAQYLIADMDPERAIEVLERAATRVPDFEFRAMVVGRLCQLAIAGGEPRRSDRWLDALQRQARSAEQRTRVEQLRLTAANFEALVQATIHAAQGGP